MMPLCILQMTQCQTTNGNHFAYDIFKSLSWKELLVLLFINFPDEKLKGPIVNTSVWILDIGSLYSGFR